MSVLGDKLMKREGGSFKVEYYANENPEKIAYVGQRLMYPIIKKLIIPYHANLFFKCH